MMKANSSLPRSCRCDGLTTRSSGACCDSSTSIDDGEGQRRQPLADHVEQPQIVENQCGLTDIVQSTTAKVTVRPKISRPPPESRCMLAGQRRVAGAILLGRPALSRNARTTRWRSRATCADDEERRVQVGCLARGSSGRPRPRRRGVQWYRWPMPSDDRQEEHGHDRQRAGGGLEDAADDHAPGAARQVLHHQQRQAARARRRSRTRRRPGRPGRNGRGPSSRSRRPASTTPTTPRTMPLRWQPRALSGGLIGVRCHVVLAS